MTDLTGNIYTVEIPEKSIGVGIANGIFHYTRNSAPIGESLIQTRLLCGSYRLIGVWPVLSEQQAGEVVEKISPYGRLKRFKHYKISYLFCLTALDSLNSLMEAKGITGTVAIIEKLTS